MGNSTNSPIKSVSKAITIIQTLRELERSGVTQIANQSEFPKSTTYRYLTALQESGFVVKEGGTYRLSLRFLEYGEFVRGSFPMSDLFIEKTNDLADLTSERTQFIVEENRQGVHFCSASGEHGILAGASPGTHTPLHATSAGKAILAFKPRDWVESYIDEEGLTQYTENTITDKDALLDALDEIRESKIAYNREERVTGLLSVGSPVVQDGIVYGAFSITGAKRRMQGKRLEDDIPEKLLKHIEEVELKIKYDEV